jgi:hypothetical protein
MEFASEMIMQASEAGLVIEEVPITYHEREGEATLESFRDGWRHVKFMLVNAPGYLFSGPGIILALAGAMVMTLAFFDIGVQGTTLRINSMIAGSLFTIVGAQVACFGAFATVAGEPIRSARDPLTTVLVDRINLEHGATAGFVIFSAGAAYSAYVLWEWAAFGFKQVPVAEANVAALTAMVLGLQIVFSSFLLSSLVE